MSNGTLRVLAWLIAVSQQPPPSLIVIEEPAVTVHSDALDALRIAGHSMQVVMTTHSPDLLDAQWIADQHIRIASWAAGISQIRPVSSAVRETLRERLMGAGELLKANALWPDKDSPVGPLFLALHHVSIVGYNFLEAHAGVRGAELPVKARLDGMAGLRCSEGRRPASDTRPDGNADDQLPP